MSETLVPASASRRDRALLAIAAADAGAIGTPAFIVDIAAVRLALTGLQSVLPSVALHYAYKSCPIPAIAAAMVDAGVSFEIASVAELAALVSTGAAADSILFSNPIKAPGEIATAYAAGVAHYCADSVCEVEKLARWAPGSRLYVRLAVDDSTSVFPLSAKFGVDASTALGIMLLARDAGLEPWGVTFHVGSQCLHASAWADAIAKAGLLMTDLRELGIEIAALNIGGGFPVRYQTETPDLVEIGATIMQAVTDRLPYPVDVVAEPGRVLVADAATAVSTVIGRATRRDGEWLYLDIGVFTGVMEALEEGDSVGPPIVAPESDGPSQAYTVAGPTCDQADMIAREVSLPAGIAVGDRVALLSAGAYSLSYTGAFCGFEAPELAVVNAAG